jgi:hypothetical protein
MTDVFSSPAALLLDVEDNAHGPFCLCPFIVKIFFSMPLHLEGPSLCAGSLKRLTDSRA